MIAGFTRAAAARVEGGAPVAGECLAIEPVRQRAGMLLQAYRRGHGARSQVLGRRPPGSITGQSLVHAHDDIGARLFGRRAIAPVQYVLFLTLALPPRRSARPPGPPELARTRPWGWRQQTRFGPFDARPARLGMPGVTGVRRRQQPLPGNRVDA